MKSLHSSLSFPHSFFTVLTIHNLAKLLAFAKSYEVLPNRIRFSPFSYISTAFSDKEIHLPTKIRNILFLFTFSRHTIPETPDFCRKVYLFTTIPATPCVTDYRKKKVSVKNATAFMLFFAFFSGLT